MGLFESKAIGRLTENPVLKQVQIGSDSVSVCEFSVAVNYGFGTNKKTEFVNCVAWRGLADVIAKHFQKGRKIYVSGHQQTRTYDKDVNGTPVKMYRTEWVIDDFDFCDSVNQGQSSASNQESIPQSPYNPVLDDDAPF